MSLAVLTSPLLAAAPGIRHGFFTRRGGVSTGVYESLNLGSGSRDEARSVAENRARVAATFGVDAAALTICWQIHSARVVVAEFPWAADRPRGDGVVTARAGLICGALAADCAPVLIADPGARVVAAVHAGWRGALEGVVHAAVEAMRGLGGDPARMVAAVGPCIGPASYEVGLEFVGRFARAATGSERFFVSGASADKRLFDLPAFVLDRLKGAGVAQCEWIGRDTFAEEHWFFSNRRAVKRGEDDYGRLISAITLAAR